MKPNHKYNIKAIIREELNNIIREQDGKYGRLLDAENFDPVDPEVYVQGFGTMTRSSLHMDIAKRLISIARTAKQAASSSTNAYDKFKVLQSELGDKSQIMQLIKAELDVANELEAIRTRGGRRTTPIPKQN